jgi:hypothetical protein
MVFIVTRDWPSGAFAMQAEAPAARVAGSLPLVAHVWVLRATLVEKQIPRLRLDLVRMIRG